VLLLLLDRWIVLMWQGSTAGSAAWVWLTDPNKCAGTSDAVWSATTPFDAVRLGRFGPICFRVSVSCGNAFSGATVLQDFQALTFADAVATDH
jgi:hypothetical protein